MNESSSADAPTTAGSPHIITIDRLTPFNPVAFLDPFGSEWVTVKEDSRSLSLCEVNLTTLTLQTINRSGVIGCYTGMHSDIALDAKIFQTLWENPDLIPESLKYRMNYESSYLMFPGTTLGSITGIGGEHYMCLGYYRGNPYWHIYNANKKCIFTYLDIPFGRS